MTCAYYKKQNVRKIEQNVKIEFLQRPQNHCDTRIFYESECLILKCRIKQNVRKILQNVILTQGGSEIYEL